MPNLITCLTLMMCYDKLRHMNYNFIQRLINLKLLPSIFFRKIITKTSFLIIKRSTEPLSLIHSDISDLKLVQTRGGKSIKLLL